MLHGMSARTLVLVALAGAAAFMIWRLWPEPDEGAGDRKASTPADAKGVESAAQESTVDEEVPLEPDPPRAMVPPPPTRMRSTGGAGNGDDVDRHVMSDQFAAEPRNDEWAPAREAQVNARVVEILTAAAGEAPPGAAPVTAGKAECHTHTCRLKLTAGDTRSLARVLEWFGDPRGFSDSADDMLVEAVEKGDDGPRVVNIFLRYAR